MSYKKLGDYIQPINIRNKDLVVETLLGVSIRKVLMPSIANTIGTNMKTYKVIEKYQFAYGPVTSRNGDKISIALLEEHEKAIISQAYVVFEVKDKGELDPEYLMMWFRRPEFDRYARFKSHGSARETFDWDELCEVELPIPNITKQREIVKEYNTVVNRITLNEKLNQKLEETAQALYKYWFVDFEFPNEQGKPYKSSGGEMEYCEELDNEIPKGWEVKSLNQIISFSSRRIETSKLNSDTYISTKNMLANKKGISKANSLSTSNTVINFIEGNILISNIRPYLKKIWLAKFNGGCSNDVLCFEVEDKINLLFLYSILEQDLFFDYIMQGAKGTKMPRGDKDWIMNYKIVIPKESTISNFNSFVATIVENKTNNSKEFKTLNDLSKILLAKMTKVEMEKV